MTTLIAVFNSDGCVGRCDAKCYNATSPECECVCGGMNHGRGIKMATDNTRELAEQWIAEYARQKGLQDGEYRAEVPALEPVQLSLL